MLQLKLAAIQAKLKLKKLQKKRRGEAGGDGQGSEVRPTNAERRPSNASRTQQQQQQKVQVPHSPIATRAEPTAPKSPSRVLLGIDKGLRGRDVSLRRPPPYRAVNTRATSPSEQPRKTYSERIAEERAKEKAKTERQKVIEKSRSTGFTFDGPVATSFNAGGNGGVGVGSSLTSAPSAPQPHPTPGGSRIRPPTSLTPAHEYDPFISASTAATTTPPTEAETDSAGFDSFSTLHLSSRLMPHPTLSRHLSSKTIFLLPTLLKTVVAPEFEPPDIEGDWVVMGIVCSKSEPRDVGQNTGYRKKGAESSSKYMVMQITDLKWEIEIFLFGSGFDKFWKVSVGTIVAIMNPGIMKPRNADTGRFSLTLSDDSDTLLEIGRSRDLAFCKAVKRDGKQCHQWVDKRHTHFCSFHVEAGIKKARVGRAEVNSMSKLFSPPKKGQVRPKRFFGKGAGGGGGGGSSRDDGLLHEGPIGDMPQRAGGAGGKVFVAPGRSAKSLLDDDGYLGDAFHRGSREERLQKRLAASEKERQITRRIIESQGREGGVGVDYLKLGVDRWDIKERGVREKAAEVERVRNRFLHLTFEFAVY